jgi:NADH-quinone oxidoreductase subunit C
MNTTDSTRERLAGSLATHQADELQACDGILSLRTELGTVHELLRSLRDEGAFEICTLITAIDHDEDSRPRAGRFEVLWQLQSVVHHDRVRVRVWLSGTEPGACDYEVPTVTDLWPGAAYYERECFDMFGIGFKGHVDLKRILMPDAYDHFPLRKEFPHGGIEPDRLYKAWDRKRRLATEEQA